MRTFLEARLEALLGRPPRGAVPQGAASVAEASAQQEHVPSKERGLPADAYPIDATGWGTGGWPWP